MLIAAVVPLFAYAALNGVLTARGVSTSERQKAQALRPAILALLNQMRRDQITEVVERARSSALRDAVLGGDGRCVRASIGGPLPGRFAATHIGVHDATGRPLGGPGNATGRWVSSPLPLATPSGHGVRQDLRRVGSVLLLITTAPITDDSGRRAAGTMVLVQQIGKRFLQRIVSPGGVSAALLHAGGVRLAAFSCPQANEETPEIVAAGVEGLLQTRKHIGVDVPLTDAMGREVASVQVLEPREAWRASVNAQVLAFAIGLMLTIVAPGRALGRRSSAHEA